MTISNLHAWQGTQQEYEALRLALFKQLEGNKTAPYYDTAGARHPTIGVGFNLDDQRVRERVFDEMRIPASQRGALRTIIADRSILNTADPNATLRSRLDAALGRPFVMNDTEIQAVFSGEAALREASVTGSSGVPTGTYEMLALLS